MTFVETAQMLGNFGEFVGAIAVVLTLVYLTAEIRRSTLVARSSVRQDITQMTVAQVADMVSDRDWVATRPCGARDATVTTTLTSKP